MQQEPKPGYKKTKIAWIPKEWNVVKLKNIAEIRLSNVDKKINNGEMKVFLCNYLDVYKYDYITPDLNFMVGTAKKNEFEKFSLKKGDVIITKDSEVREDIAVPAYVKEDIPKLVCGYHLALLKPKNNTDGLFLAKVLQSEIVNHFFQRRANGITRFGLNQNTIKTSLIPLPPLPEQRKIAQILSVWDKAIELTGKLIAAKERQKKGLMQRILTGKIRFPEFIQNHGYFDSKIGKLPKDWKYPHIGDIAEQTNIRNGSHKNHLVLTCTKHSGLVPSLEFFGKQIFSKDLSTYKIVGNGEFVYATNHIEEGSIGYQDLTDVALVSPMYTTFKTNSQVNDIYLYSLLKTETYRRIFEINTNATVNRRGSLRWHGFANIHVPLPPRKEQDKITFVISTFNREIELLYRKLSALRRQKKGLMQKLLTGKIRVKIIETNS